MKTTIGIVVVVVGGGGLAGALILSLSARFDLDLPITNRPGRLLGVGAGIADMGDANSR